MGFVVLASLASATVSTDSLYLAAKSRMAGSRLARNAASCPPAPCLARKDSKAVAAALASGLEFRRSGSEMAPDRTMVMTIAARVAFPLPESAKAFSMAVAWLVVTSLTPTFIAPLGAGAATMLCRNTAVPSMTRTIRNWAMSLVGTLAKLKATLPLASVVTEMERNGATLPAADTVASWTVRTLLTGKASADVAETIDKRSAKIRYCVTFMVGSFCESLFGTAG